MKQDEIEIILAEILIKKLGISETDISSESTMKELGADSLDEVEIVFELEERLGIYIPENILPRVHTIGGFCNYIEKEFEL